MALAIESVSIDSLTPYPNNPRRGDTTVIAESLSANGQFRPLVVSADNIVLAGNHTLEAAASLGWAEIDVVRLPFDGDTEEATRVVLADNRAADLGSYDDADLVLLLDGLDDLTGTGYLADDLEDLKHLTTLRDTTAGGEDSHYSGTGLDVDGVIPDKGLQALADDYASKAVRSVILAYSLEDFEEVSRLMASARVALDVESNSEAILALLRSEYAGS